MASMERFCDIRRAELNDYLLASRGRVFGVFEAKVGVEAKRFARPEDRGDGERDEGCSFEEEADPVAIDSWLLYEW